MRSISLLVLLIAGWMATAQSPEVQARAAFLKAQELYGNGDYAGAIERLDNVKELLGSSNPRVEYLLCQSHFAMKDAGKADLALKKYFEMADESDPNYNQMLLMIEEIKEKKEEFRRLQEEEKRQQALLAQEPEIWEEAKAKNTRTGYENYLRVFPKGTYANEARKSLLAYPPSPLTDQRDNITYETVRLGGLIWMKSNLKYASPNSRCYDDDAENCTEHGRIYNFIDARQVCPKGWRLPRFNELQTLIRTFDMKETAKKNPNVMHAFFSDGSFGPLEQELGLYAAGTFVRKNPPGIKEDTYKLMGDYAVIWTQDGRLVLNAAGKKKWLQLANTDKIPGFRETDKSLFGYCRCVKGESSPNLTVDDLPEELRNRLQNVPEAMREKLIQKALEGMKGN